MFVMCVKDILLKHRQLYIVGQVATERNVSIFCVTAGLDNCGNLLPDEVINR
jgi:hypothetical protein